MSELLALGIFEGMTTQQEVQDKIIEEFASDRETVDQYEYLIVYTDYGSYEGTGWLLMRNKETGELFDNNSGHCSCYGNEGQFEPEPTNLPYLKSLEFHVYSYGGEESKIKDYIKNMQ